MLPASEPDQRGETRDERGATGGLRDGHELYAGESRAIRGRRLESRDVEQAVGDDVHARAEAQGLP